MRQLEQQVIDRIEDIANIARELIMGDESDNCNFIEKVKDSGVQLFDMSNEKYDGLSMWSSQNQAPEIYVEKDQSSGRKMFTIAHELGHLFIDFKWIPGSKISANNAQNILSVHERVHGRGKDKIEDTEDISERVANQFAASFLMPIDLVKSQIDNSSFDDDDEKVKLISKYFGVTLIAATNRLRVLGYINE